MQNNKVSIIMPAYNCERFIVDAIKAVQSQTYTNWELIIVDDCSKDRTNELMKAFACSDSRIICLENEKNMGAAASRNRAVLAATGSFIAFLDGDDIWIAEKLEKQLEYMKNTGFTFTCTSYGKIDENGKSLDKVVRALDADYEGLLKRGPGNSTVIYNAEVLGKYTIPLIKKRNDYVMWLSVIKKAKQLHGLDEVLGYHRVGMQSLSSNKVSLVKYHWIVYREVEKLPFFKCVGLVIFWIIRGVFKIQ